MPERNYAQDALSGLILRLDCFEHFGSIISQTHNLWNDPQILNHKNQAQFLEFQPEQKFYPVQLGRHFTYNHLLFLSNVYRFKRENIDEERESELTLNQYNSNNRNRHDLGFG